MKNLTLLFGICFTLQVQAQYYEHHYGNQVNQTTIERHRQHVPSTATGAGYVMVGESGLGSTQLYTHVIRTDNSGTIPFAPYFNNAYNITDVVTGTPYRNRGTSVVEIPNGGSPEYAIAGTIFLNNATNDGQVYYMRLDASGNVLLNKRYYLPGYNHRSIKMNISSNGNTLYITGYCSAIGGNGSRDVIVFSVDAATAALNWGKRYDVTTGGGQSMDDFGVDIIENAYNTGELLVVGRSDAEGLLLRIDATTGAPALTNPCQRYVLTANHNDHIFTAIKKSSNPVMTTNDGFIIGGFGYNTNLPGNESWTLLVDQYGSFASGWSTYHTSSSSNSMFNEDIMERYSTALAAYEYYAAGFVVQSATDDDLFVLKLDQNGTSAANTEFWYGIATEKEQAYSIVQSNTGGFNVAGFVESSTDFEQLQINAYYNGVTACNYTRQTPTTNSAGTVSSYTVTDYGTPSDDDFNVSTINMLDKNVCFSNSEPDGSNNRSAYTGPKLEFSIRNNGNLGAANSIVEVVSEQPIQNKVSVKLVDVLGREIKNLHVIHNGQSLSIHTGVLKQGLYYLSISDGQSQQSKTLLVR